MWELKVYFYPSAGGLKRKNKKKTGVLFSAYCDNIPDVISGDIILSTMYTSMYICMRCSSAQRWVKSQWRDGCRRNKKKEKRDSALYHFKHGSGYYCKELRLKRCRYVLYIVNIIWYRSPRWSCGYPRMLLLLIAMIAEFDFLYGDIVNEFCKNNK